MKLILSRKGWDAATGGVPSPIIDGQLIPLPIPTTRSHKRYAHLHLYGHPLGKIVQDLTGGRITRRTKAHVDPDLCPVLYRRLTTIPWRPLFGQVGSAQSHLNNQSVGPGDLFLFFGWFREAENIGGVYRYVPGAPDLHILYGWLHVGEAWPVGAYCPLPCPPWAREHPHLQRDYGSQNTLYVAQDTLDLGQTILAPGGGLFRTRHPTLQLTAPGATRSVWSLPAWFYPTEKRPPLTYHSYNRWEKYPDHTILRSVGRGQEFVLNCDAYPAAVPWLVNLFDTVLPLAV